jgi:uncharacterized protein
MSTLIELVKRYQLLVFFALAYLISWLPQLFESGGIFPFGPLIAAVVVLLLIGGRTELRAWWHYIAHWRGGLGWYALAIVLPFAINAAAAWLAVLFGAQTPSAEKIAAWPDLLINFIVYAIAFGPLGEEPGWRGFALPRILSERSQLVRTLILGLFIAVWHLPLVVGGQQPASMLLSAVVSQVLYTWLANRSGIPVLLVILAHAAQGGLGGAFFGPMFSGADAVLETNLLVAIYCAVAIVIVLFTGSGLGQRTNVQVAGAQIASQSVTS